MDCSSCQAHNSDDRRFCAECGAPLATLCHDCGFENQPGARFCGGCGRALGDAAPTAEPKGAAEVAEGERRQVTVLFADLAGFTALSSGLDAEDLHDLMERFFACMDGIIESYGGTVDKHIGDALRLVLGAGAEVVSVTPERASLEDIFMTAVNEDASESAIAAPVEAAAGTESQR